MPALLHRRPNLLLVVLAGYFLLQFVARLCMPHSLELDEAEQTLLAQWLSAGYNSQPPFYNWLQYGVTSLLGVSLVSLALLKNLLLFGSYLFYWLTARMLLKNRDLATIATLSLLAIPQVSFEAQRDLTHTVAVIFCACLFLYGMFRTLKRQDTLAYVITGIALGAGLISKYNFALLPAAAFGALLLDREDRKVLFNWRLLLTAAVSIVIVLPHALWFAENYALATSRTFTKMYGTGDDSALAQIWSGLLSLLTAVPSFAGLAVAIFFLMFGKRLFGTLGATSRWTRVVERLLLLELGALLFLIVFAGVENIRDRWMTPLLMVVPLYICLKIDAAEIDLKKALRISVATAATIMVAVIAILSTRMLIGPLVGDYQRLNIPYRALAEIISREVGASPAAIVSIDPHLAGNMRLQMPDAPVMSPIYSDFQPSFQWDATHPVVFVWRERYGGPPPALPGEFQTWLDSRIGPGVTPETRIVSLPYIYGRPGDTYQFAYALIYPR
ncbi:glycosyltransferase family 39 protein [Rhizobium sp. BK251]|uniref:glycosyltransferase family 39 protein n=1 Tax=Rhizobium sp. BK251 TaxID=2512125 RepID=UPI001042D15C|nr:glycosyltransferase family 39 protein [Rhizobium sp. BK251]TCL76219.1 4-amino-4-deoxy-L-arabinose transferase-like glycosyltransferase [Rhizobium sp. BK251]